MEGQAHVHERPGEGAAEHRDGQDVRPREPQRGLTRNPSVEDRKSTRLNSSHSQISYAVFCLKKKNKAHAVVAFLDTDSVPLRLISLTTLHRTRPRPYPYLHIILTRTNLVEVYLARLPRADLP